VNGWRRPFRALAVVVLVWLPDTSAAVAGDIGRAIFRGTAPTSGSAILGAGGMRVPAVRVPCAACHGRDAQGGSEGGLVAPAIDRKALSTATGKRPAYTPRGFAKAVTQGVDTSGRALDRAMPRYAFGDAELTALLAYLGRVWDEQRTGVTTDAVRFAILVPPGRERAGQAIRTAFLQTWRDLGDAQPHGRRLEMEVLALDVAGEDTASRLNAAGVFAVVLAIPDGERRLYGGLAEAGVPLLFPLGQAEGNESPLDVRTAFAAVRDEIAGLLAAAGTDGRVVADPWGLERLRALGFDRGRRVETVDDYLSTPSNAPSIILLGGPEAVRRLSRADLNGVIVYRLGSDVRQEASSGLHRAGAKVMMSVPYDAEVWNAERLTAQRLTLLAARAVREGLAEAGRDLTRSNFMTALGTLRLEQHDWPALDFRLYPLTGTRVTGIVPAP
jgi:mono/diheme cytochrome c family protein